jgi:flagellar motor switch protein FliG
MPAPATANDLKFLSVQRSGAEKVAILLLAMGSPLGSKVLQSFDPEEVKRVSQSASSIGPVETADLEKLIDEFARHFTRAAGFGGDAREVQALLEQAFPAEQLNSIIADPVAPQKEPVWNRLGAAVENTLVPYLLDEHPQAAAFIVSKLDPNTAAKILALLPRQLRDSVARRLLKIADVSEVASAIAEDCLRDDLHAKAPTGEAKEGRARVATLINKMEREHADGILESMANVDPEEAKALRLLLFSFEDIAKIDQKARLVLFDKVPTDRLAPALKATEPAFRELILSSLGARARRMIEAELGNVAGEVTREVTAARRAIADIALDLAAKGEISLAAPEAPAA